LAKLRPNVARCGHGRSQVCQRSDARGGKLIIEKAIKIATSAINKTAMMSRLWRAPEPVMRHDAGQG